MISGRRGGLRRRPRRGERVYRNRDVRHAVERQPTLVAGGEVGLVGEDGAGLLGALATFEGGGQLHFEMNQQRAGSGEQQRARGGVLDGASAESQHQRVGCGQGER